MQHMKRLILPLAALLLLIAVAHRPVAPARTFAYLVACTTFLDRNWIPLPETGEEVDVIQKELEGRFGTVCEVLKNPKTPDAITDGLDAFTKKHQIGPDDRLLVFLSSHGYYNTATKRGYLIPSGGEANAQHSKTWLSYDDLGTTLTLHPSQHVLLLLDACYSGSFLDRFKNGPDEPDYDRSSDCAEKIKKADRFRARLACTAGNTLARTPAQSKFAAKFLALLRTRETINFRDLRLAFLEIENPTPESGQFIGNEDGADFILVQKGGCGATPIPTPTLTPKDADLQAIERARKADTEAEWQNYLDFWPTGRYRPEASTALARKKEESVWKTAQDRNTTQAYQYYHDLYCPGGTYCPKAAELLKAKPDNMVFIKGGTFQMGSSDGGSDEQPVHEVRISDFYMGKYEVTVAEFRKFVEAENYKTEAEKGDGSTIYKNGSWSRTAGVNWRHDTEGNTQTDENHPVIHISWNDATAYCAWLSRTTGKKYRLPTEAEWEYAAGNGSKHTKYSWGNSDPSGKKGGNVADKTAKARFTDWTIFDNYTDGYIFTAPVGSFDPNEFGLYDMSGNVWEWCSDWYGAAPFPHIAAHIVQTEGVRLVTAHG
jgi:formylglycine-generating enzyme